MEAFGNEEANLKPSALNAAASFAVWLLHGGLESSEASKALCNQPSVKKHSN